MANDKNLVRLWQGVAAWNDWRAQDREEPVDLTTANLEGANLRGANLSKADLRGANLRGADLSKADLRGANLTPLWSDWRNNLKVPVDLSGANLSGAMLGGAQLDWANLESANLESANLERANLEMANLENANLKRANLKEAHIRKAKLAKARLRGATLRSTNLEQTELQAANLEGADLAYANLSKADLRGANLRGAFLINANFQAANIDAANLDTADLRGAHLSVARLCGADLQRTNLTGADLQHTDLTGANLHQANLSSATLIKTNFAAADLTGCRVYGISAWDLGLDKTKQRDLVITNKDQPDITVDNIEVAQFIYLLLYNNKIRNIIDTITSKVVLILGRFTPERKAMLDALREELRHHDYLPVLFDFDKPASRDITETISLLARMARFVVADVTDARSIPQELMVIVPDLPSVPVQPLLQEGSGEYGMFEHFRRYPWVLKEYVYASPHQLIADISQRVIGPAEAKVRAMRGGAPDGSAWSG